jgi:hypothetical protein
VPLPLALKRRVPIDQPDQVVVLSSDPRPLPTVHQYDQLLTAPRPQPVEEMLG